MHQQPSLNDILLFISRDFSSASLSFFFSSFFSFFYQTRGQVKLQLYVYHGIIPLQKKKCFFKSVLVFTSLQIWILLPYLPHIFLISFQFWRMYVPPCCKHKCLSATSDFAQRAICLWFLNCIDVLFVRHDLYQYYWHFVWWGRGLLLATQYCGNIWWN